jgi:UDP-glucose 4-epimerase
MDYLTDKVVAVTGSSGFIGKSLVNALTGSVDQLILVVRNVNQKTVHKQIEFDLVSTDIPQDFFSGVDYIFHLAGCAHDTNRIIDKDYYYKINVEATVNLAKFAIKNKVKKFIFVSSVKAAGKNLSDKYMSETDRSSPEDWYGETKYEAENKLLELAKNTKMDVVIIRPTLVYGPDVKGNLRLMLSAIEKGWFPPLSKKNKNSRSMVHVDDLVRALIFLAKDDRASGEIFIVSDGIEYSTRDVYEIMCNISNVKIPRWSVPNSFFKIVARINSNLNFKIQKLFNTEKYSSEKLKSLGFKPKKTLKDMHETSF